MARLLIVYGSTEGHTRKVAARMAEVAREYGHAVEVTDSAAPGLPDPAAYDGVILAGSLHRSRHQRSLEAYATTHRDALSHQATAFFSVSLSAAGGSAPELAAARGCVDDFVQRTGWRPGMVRLVAGALAYSRYNWFVRFMMRRIARKAGGDTDTSRDYEYTDWEALRRDVETFLTHAVPPAPAPRPRESAAV